MEGGGEEGPLRSGGGGFLRTEGKAEETMGKLNFRGNTQKKKSRREAKERKRSVRLTMSPEVLFEFRGNLVG